MTAPTRPLPGPVGAEPRPEDWVVLAGADVGPRKADRAPRTRDTVLQVVVIGIVLSAFVALAGAFIIKRLAEQEAVHGVAEKTDVLAQSVVQPALTDAMTRDPAAATRILRPAIAPSLTDSLVVRVKVWNPGGTIVYSDEQRLIGRSFPLDDEARDALQSPQTIADISNLQRPENRFERGDGKLLEVYRPVWTPSGRPLLLEAYFRYDTVNDRSSGLWRGFAGILISTIAALLILIVPLVAYLLSRTKRAHQQREAMAQRALAASDEERRRIGASLHDGVVQQLAAASFDLAGRAHRAAAAGDAEHAQVLTAAAATVRGTVGGLRSLLVEIYPPTVGSAGLSSTLRDLASADSRATVSLDIDESVVATLAPATQEEMFRVAQECLRNVAKHSGAHRVVVRVYSVSAGRVRMEIEDDGTGFDAAADAADGHLGLELIADAARRCGAELAVASRPGQGARFRMDVPVS
jgi:two-component system, NarL family, sensor kinase